MTSAANGADADARGRRAKRTALGLVAVAAGLGILAWSQPWFSFSIPTDAGIVSGEASGDTASPATMALSLAGLAAVAALALAGHGFRVVLGALTAIVGACQVYAALLGRADPAGAIGPKLTEHTGIDGGSSIAALVAAGQVSESAWPVAAVLGGALMAVAGVLAVWTSRAWPASGRRFRTDADAAADASGGARRAVRFEDADGAAAPRARDRSGRPADHASAGDERVTQWDALSHGDDPTDAPDRPID